MGQKEKTEEKKKREKKRPKVGDTDGKLHMVHASTHGTRKLPGPTFKRYLNFIFFFIKKGNTWKF